MEAIQFDLKNKKLTLIKLEIPDKLAEDDVLIQVAFSGICGTDLHIIEGHFPVSSKPVTLGHEFCGVATKVGAGVTHIAVGDKVAVDPNSGCDTCKYCTGGCYHFCLTGGINNTVGIYRNGGWAQYCRVPAKQVYKVPENITLEQAALTEPLSCISHGWDRIVPVPLGNKILIQGAGIIGNFWAAVLHLQGHRHVTISEPQEARRNLFQNLGTGYTTVHPDQLKASKTADEAWGFDLVIDCSGFAPAIQDAMTYLVPGGRLCVFGVASPEARMSISPYLIYKNELTIIGVNINPFSFPKALGIIDALGSKYLEYKKLGIQVFKLSEYAEAIALLKKGTIAKAVFKVK